VSFAMPAIRPEDTVVELLKYQSKFIHDKAPYPAAVTAWGTGKTLAGIVKAVSLSARNPGNLGMVLRREFTDLRDSTIRDFEDYTGLKVDSSRNCDMGNGSSIMFRHLEETNNIQNVNLGWFWIEQAEELDSDERYFKLFGRLRRKGMPHCGFITANTKGHNWVWRLWKQGSFAARVRELVSQQPDLFKHLSGKELDNLSPLFEATTYDNRKNLSPSFLAGLEIMRQEKPRLYNRFVLNSWDDDDTADALIPAEWVEQAVRRAYAPSGDVVLGVDVARFGDDNTVIFPVKGRIALKPIVLRGNDTMQVVGKIGLVADEMKAKKIMVDTIGIGSGVFDRLKELKYPAYEVNVSQESTVIDSRTGKPKFKKLRSEIWWKARESINPNTEIQPAPMILPNDDKFKEELTVPKYTINSSGQIEVESKDSMKERMGRSPDIADAYCLAVHGQDQSSKAWGFYGSQVGIQRANWM
jgi:hypothetical protein